MGGYHRVPGVPALTPMDAGNISVVIPAHDAGAYLAGCLASVQVQTALPGEIIVVDDASSDDTAKVAAAHPATKLIRLSPQRGPAAARNAGIFAARGEYVAFLDADDLWPPDSLAARVAVVRRHADAALVFGDCQQFDEYGPYPRTLFEDAGLGTDAWGARGLVPNAYRRLLDANFVTTGSVLARRQALVDAGGFDESLRLVEDLDLWLRLASQHAVAWCGDLCLLRRRHATNLSRDTEAMSWAYIRVLNRHAAAADRGEMPPFETAGLIARELAILSELALASGRAHLAWQRAWQSLLTCPTRRGMTCLVRAAAASIRHGAIG